MVTHDHTLETSKSTRVGKNTRFPFQSFNFDPIIVCFFFFSWCLSKNVKRGLGNDAIIHL